MARHRGRTSRARRTGAATCSPGIEAADRHLAFDGHAERGEEVDGGAEVVDDDELVIGCFPDLAIVAAKEFGLDYPSRLAERFITSMPGRSVYLVAMHSVVDFFGYAIWRDGTLQRSLSVSPDSGVMEDVGDRLPFEEPYWAGKHPAVDPAEDDDEYSLVFHPLELGEAALGALFGYQMEGTLADVDPNDVPLMRFKRSRSWWRRW